MTQIYGTFGPACGSRETLEAMFRAGMTGMRLNLSHCDLADSAGMLEAFREAEAAALVKITTRLATTTSARNNTNSDSSTFYSYTISTKSKATITV